MTEIGRLGGGQLGGGRIDRALDERQSRYEYIAYQIEREDGLANYRLTWTLQLNGFLFAALALIGDEMDTQIGSTLKVVLPIAGMLISLMGLLGTFAVLLVVLDLRDEWEDRQDDRWPRPLGRGRAFWLGQLTNLFVPIALVLVWCAVGILLPP